jgi:hypothetical protein
MVGRARCAWSSAGFDKSSLARAIAALSEGRVESEPMGTLEPEALAASSKPAQAQSAAAPATAPAVQAPSAEQAPSSDADGGYPTWRKRTGYAMIPLAIAFAGVGFGLAEWSQPLRDKLVHSRSGDVPFPGLRAKYDRVSAASYLGVASAPLGVAAAALLVRARASVPWWSYTLSALGLGAAGVGIYQVAIANQCQLAEEVTNACLRKRETERRGVLLVAASVPLISVPIFHLVRRQKDERAQLSALNVPGGAGLLLSGSY